MLNSQRTKIEALKEQIDNALLSIYYAKERGYSHVNFQSLLMEYLSSDNISEYKNQVNKYLAVFLDLNQDFGSIHIKTIEIDKTNGKYKTKKQTVYKKQLGVSNETEQEHDIPDSLKSFYAAKNDPSEISEININITKLNFYLEASEIFSDKDYIGHYIFFADVESLFKRYGFTTPDHNYTFEIYIEGLTLIQTPVDLEPININGLLYPEKIAHKILVLKKLGVIDKLKEALQNSDKTNLTKLLAIILNITVKAEIETLRKALSDLETKGFNNLSATNKVNQILVQFGIKTE